MGLFSTKKTADSDYAGDGSLGNLPEPSVAAAAKEKGARKGKKGNPNPFLDQGRTEIYGFFYDQAKGRRNWQIVAFSMMALNAVLVVSLIGLAFSVSHVPYIVERGDMGEARYIGPLEQLQDVEGRAKPAVITRWVKEVRSIYDDPAARQDMLYQSYAHTANDALDKLQAYYADPDTDPGRLSRAGTSRSIEIESIVLVPNPNQGASASETYKVSWKERTKKSGPGGLSTQRHEGYFSVIVIPPATDEVAARNPLGIYISDFNWGEVSGSE